MVKFNIFLILFLLVLPISKILAQETENGSPQESPYVSEENEYDENVSTQEEDEAEPDIPEKKLADEEVKKAADAEAANGTVIKEIETAPVSPADSEITTQSNEEQASTPVVPLGKRAGVKYIPHPMAAKGLLAITKDGKYIYSTDKKTKVGKSGSLRFATIDSPKIKASDGTTFAQMYAGSQQKMVMFDYEWQPITGAGKLGIQAGFGLMFASGKGRFVSDDPTINGQEAKESYRFFAVPLNLGFIYRLQIFDRQWLAPFVAGGGTVVAVAEARDDSKAPVGLLSPGGYGSGGMMFNISAMNYETAYTLNSEYGISNLWLNLEYRFLKTVSKDVEFSSNIISAGVSVDY